MDFFTDLLFVQFNMYIGRILHLNHPEQAQIPKALVIDFDNLDCLSWEDDVI